MEQLEYYKKIVTPKGHILCEELQEFKNLVHNVNSTDSEYRSPDLPDPEHTLASLYTQISLNMIDIEHFFEDSQMIEIKQLLHGFMEILSLYKNLIRPKNSVAQAPKNAVQPLCPKCKGVGVQGELTDTRKKGFGVTFGDIDEKFKKGVIDLISDLDKDMFFDKQNQHIKDLTFHLDEVFKTLQKQFESKTLKFLKGETDTRRVSIKKQGLVFEENNKEFQRSLAYLQNFKDNFFSSIKMPIQQTVIKIVSNIEKKKKSKDMYKNMEIQTVISNEFEQIKNLNGKIAELKKQIQQLEGTKKQREQTIDSCLKDKKQLQKDLSIKNRQMQNLEQKYRTVNQNWKKSEIKLQYQMQVKERQIHRLQKQNKQLHTKLTSKQNISTNRNLSVPEKKRKSQVNQTKEVKEQIVYITNPNKKFKDKPRPSLDNWHIMQEEKKNAQNRLKAATRKYTSFLKTESSSAQFQRLDISKLAANKTIDDIGESGNQDDTISQRSIQSRKETIISEKIQKKLSKRNSQKASERGSQRISQTTSQRNSKKIHLKIPPHQQLEPQYKKPQEDGQKEQQNRNFKQSQPKEDNDEKNEQNAQKQNYKVQVIHPPSNQQQQRKLPKMFKLLKTVTSAQRFPRSESLDLFLPRENSVNTLAPKLNIPRMTSRVRTEQFEKFDLKGAKLPKQSAFQRMNRTLRLTDNLKKNNCSFGINQASLGQSPLGFTDRMGGEESSQKVPKIPLISENLQLFGDQQGALQYQQNQGLWEHVEQKNRLILDYQHANFCKLIEKYFEDIRKWNEERYLQYMVYFKYPYQYVNALKNNTTLIAEPLKHSQIHTVFLKLLRFHKLKHRKCQHVTSFLTQIGFYQKWLNY